MANEMLIKNLFDSVSEFLQSEGVRFGCKESGDLERVFTAQSNTHCNVSLGVSIPLSSRLPGAVQERPDAAGLAARLTHQPPSEPPGPAHAAGASTDMKSGFVHPHEPADQLHNPLSTPAKLRQAVVRAGAGL